MAIAFAAEGQNVAFLASFGMSIAACANLPALLLTMYWKRMTARAVLSGILVGLGLSLAVILLSPVVQGADAPLAFSNPALAVAPISLIVSVLVALAGKPRSAAQDREFFALRTQALTGRRPSETRHDGSVVSSRPTPRCATSRPAGQPRPGRSRTLERIEALEPDVRAWVHVDPDAHATASGPLAGIPLGVKDLIDVAGMPTRCGSTLRDSRPVERDADCVALARRLGAVPIGKTVTTEFGYFAPGPTRNPHALDHTPGGSSSGSAAAVAAGMVPLAFGTQTAGSLTRPASFCGVAGLVTTRGRFSTTGITGLSPSLDSLGLLARTVDDLHYAWAAMDSETVPAELVPSRATPAGGVERVRTRRGLPRDDRRAARHRRRRVERRRRRAGNWIPAPW